MFKKLLVPLLALIGSIMSPAAHAVFVYGEIKQRNDITVVLLGDIHADKPDEIITKKQTKDFLALARILNAYCLGEDFASKFASKMKMKLNLESCLPTPLCLLGNKCKELSIPFSNFDFRYAQAAGTTFQMITDTDRVLTKIGNSSLVKTNSEIQNHFNTLQVKWQTIKDSYNNWWEKIKNYFSNQAFYKLFFLWSRNAMYHFNHSLVNLNSLYKLNKAIQKNTHKIFIIAAGQDHITQVSKLLKDLQFNSTKICNPHCLTPTNEDYLKIALDNAIDLPKFFEPLITLNEPRSKL